MFHLDAPTGRLGTSSPPKGSDETVRFVCLSDTHGQHRELSSRLRSVQSIDLEVDQKPGPLFRWIFEGTLLMDFEGLIKEPTKSCKCHFIELFTVYDYMHFLTD